MNLVQKILAKHLVSGDPKPGHEVKITIDQTLTQDATGTMTYLQFEAMKPVKLATDVSVSYVDHNTVQAGFENFDDHLYLKSVAQKYGITFSPAGNGICHQVHLERFGVPGKTLLGSDSHTPTCGGIGMFAVGAGGLDIAVAMANGTFTVAYPTVTQVRLIGKLKPWVAAKDIILKMLQLLSSKGNVDSVIEYTGPGVKTLSVPQRATIANMGAEMGVTTSVFPSDENTKRFLAAQGREKDYISLEADPGATYDKTLEINLDELEPMVALPHNPDNIAKISEVKNVGVHQVCIGSCTNSSFQDLMIAAHMLKGKKVHESVSFVVAPGSKQVLQMISDNGALSTFIAAGGRLVETACGFCIGNSMAPGTDCVSVRTANRNFQGRTGTPSAKVYLTSVETAVATALAGQITDPRKLSLEYKKFDVPEKYTIDDSMIIFGKKPDMSVTILRGPNIGQPPENTELSNQISGVVTLKVADKITTDHIMPAGDKLKYRSNIPKYSEFVFAPLDATFSKRAMENKKLGKANIIIAGLSYGQGSSREHAAICPMYLGVKAVVAKSFERIHIANLINFGILPLTFIQESDYTLLEKDDELSIPSVRELLTEKKPLKLINVTRNKEIQVHYNLTDEDIKIIIAGGKLNFLQGK